MTDFVTITEVGPRDGLQNEPGDVSTSAKVAFIEALYGAGLQRVECGSFVHPRVVPQMADTAEVFAAIQPPPSALAIALVPNLKGLERAIAAGCTTVALFAAASDGFSRANINMSVADSLVSYRVLAREALANGLAIRGYVSTIFECPYDGEVSPAAVCDVSESLLAMGCYEVSLGDTTGVGTPAETQRLLLDVMRVVDTDKLSMHFHDTFGMAVANALEALRMGIRRFDSSAGGLGGCPFAKTATGNLATEDLLYALNHLGYVTGVDLHAVARASRELSTHLGRPLPSKVVQALSAKEEGPAC